jgi:HlyD family secretion protein
MQVREHLQSIRAFFSGKNKRIIIPVSLVLLLIIIGAWYALQGATTSINGALQASGTVEADEVLVASEMAGKVAEVSVEKGAAVNANDVLLKLDDTLLQTQHQQTVAALGAAVANLSTAQAGLKAAEAARQVAQASADAAKASSEVELLSAQQALDDLNDNVELARAQAQENLASANRAVYDAQYLVDNLIIPNNQVGLGTLEAITLMKQRLDKAVKDFEPYKFESSTSSTREDLKTALDDARADYNAAVRRLEYESGLKDAEALVDKAQRDLDKLKDGPDPDQTALLEARIEAAKTAPIQAETAVTQVEAGVAQAQAILDQAQAGVAQAQSQLDLINEQLKKLVITAPISGVVLNSDIKPGEVVQPGATLMTVGQIDKLTITVYVPEDRYGQIKLGMDASVTVDSFPGERFKAQVTYIADKAEFTPRNVQTVEGRRTTVFAVELSVPNPDGKLKPGMPADVTFGN